VIFPIFFDLKRKLFLKRQQAGVSVQIEHDGDWFASIDQDDWPEDPHDRESILESMQQPWGDRRQELVFIGIDMDKIVLLSKTTPNPRAPPESLDRRSKKPLNHTRISLAIELHLRTMYLSLRASPRGIHF
jgi:hypothetical protein